MTMRNPANESGFTLIEVLIALAVVAISLGAVLHAIGAMAMDTELAKTRLLALWSADSALSDIRISSAWPAPGPTTFDCPQGPYHFVCRQRVTATSNPMLRQVAVTVYASGKSSQVLAETVTVIQNEAR
jgi:general secretion pathway protein I